LEQTIVDLAGCLDAAGLERALDHALVRDLTSATTLADYFEQVRAKRRKGQPLLAALLDDRATGFIPPQSMLEAAFDRLLRRAALPPSTPQASFPWWPTEPFRCDRLFPAWRRIVEVDGRLWHARFADFERDRARDHEAQIHGYEVTRFTYRQIVSDPSYAPAVLAAIGQHASAA
jgi:very-short-patch-repair endonuclease